MVDGVESRLQSIRDELATIKCKTLQLKALLQAQQAAQRAGRSKGGRLPKLRQSQSEIAAQLGLGRDRIGDLYRAGRLVDTGDGWKVAPKDTTKPIDNV